MIDLQFRRLSIPFKVAFRHASAERSETSTVWVEARDKNGLVGCGESCPREYVTGETLDTAQAFFQRHEKALSAMEELPQMESWVAGHRTEIEANPAAWCAIEISLLDLFAKQCGKTLESFLGLQPLEGRFQYSAVLGDAKPEVFQGLAERSRRQGLTDFKVKLSGNLPADREKVAYLVAWRLDSMRLRADANNLWPNADEAVAYLNTLKAPFFAVEEPITAGQYPELMRIAISLDCRIILDESFVRLSQVSALTNAPGCWIVNLRVSKMGGVLRSLDIIRALRGSGIAMIVGAQVGETSLLTRAALTIASAGRDILIAQEGAFGTLLLQNDVCEPPLMFGDGGVLDTAHFPSLTQPGLGLNIAA